MGRYVGEWSRRVLWPVVAVTAFAAMGEVTASSAELPAPEELSPDLVARVAEAPGGAGFVTQREFRRTLAQAAANRGRRRPPGPEDRGYERLKREAMNVLLDMAWVRGQAAEMNIRVTRRQVARVRARVIRESFDSAAEYRRFLRSARYSPRDIWKLLEVQILAERIQRRVTNRVRGRAATRRAFNAFLEAFEKRWRSRTVCAPEYVLARCSNSPHEP